MIPNPKISCILTTYNRPQYLQRAVDSILSQTFQEFELIIVDDHSDSPPNVNLPQGEDRVVPIRLHWNTGFWIRPRNIGIMLARSNYLAFLDDDNVYLPNHLELMYEAIKDDKYDMVYGDRVYKSNNPKETKFMGRMSFDFNMKKLNKGNYIDISDVMISMQMMNKIGFFDINWNRKADWLFVYKVGKNGARVKHIPEILTEYWWGEDNIGQKHPLGGKFIHSPKDLEVKKDPLEFQSQDGKWK